MSQITIPREELVQVLEALEDADDWLARLLGNDRGGVPRLDNAISTLRARLKNTPREATPEDMTTYKYIADNYRRDTQPEQEPEPVAFRYKFGLTDTLVKICGDMTHMLAQCTIDAIGGTAKYGEVTWLYASPPPRPELSGAIAAEREACARLCESYAMPDSTSETAVLLAAAIRARSAGMTDIWSSHAQKLIAAEREACARLVQDMVDMRVPASEYPAAIRARGGK